MAIPKKILKYLDKDKIGYKSIAHKKVYTAYDTAQTLKARISEIAKTLLIKADKFYILAVLPASRRLDLMKLKKVAKVKKIAIAKENVMKNVFKVSPGTITPFGELYKMPVFIDKKIMNEKKLIAGAGTYRDSVVMSAKNFLKATKGVIGDFSKKK